MKRGTVQVSRQRGGVTQNAYAEPDGTAGVVYGDVVRGRLRFRDMAEAVLFLQEHGYAGVEAVAGEQLRMAV